MASLDLRPPFIVQDRHLPPPSRMIISTGTQSGDLGRLLMARPGIVAFVGRTRATGLPPPDAVMYFATGERELLFVLQTLTESRSNEMHYQGNSGDVGMSGLPNTVPVETACDLSMEVYTISWIPPVRASCILFLLAWLSYAGTNVPLKVSVPGAEQAYAIVCYPGFSQKAYGRFRKCCASCGSSLTLSHIHVSPPLVPQASMETLHPGVIYRPHFNHYHRILSVGCSARANIL